MLFSCSVFLDRLPVLQRREELAKQELLLTIRRWKPVRNCTVSPWVLKLCFLFYVSCRYLTNFGWKMMAKRKDLWVVVMAALQNSCVCVCVCLSLFPQNNYNQKYLISDRGVLEETLSSQSSSPYFSLLFLCPLPFPTIPWTPERF